MTSYYIRQNKILFQTLSKRGILRETKRSCPDLCPLILPEFSRNLPEYRQNFARIRYCTWLIGKKFGEHSSSTVSAPVSLDIGQFSDNCLKKSVIIALAGYSQSCLAAENSTLNRDSSIWARQKMNGESALKLTAKKSYALSWCITLQHATPALRSVNSSMANAIEVRLFQIKSYLQDYCNFAVLIRYLPCKYQ